MNLDSQFSLHISHLNSLVKITTVRKLAWGIQLVMLNALINAVMIGYTGMMSVNPGFLTNQSRYHVIGLL